MFTTYTVTKIKEPKKIFKKLFVTKQIIKKKPPVKITPKKVKTFKRPKSQIIYKTQKPKESKIEIEFKKEEIEPKIETKIDQKCNIKIPPKIPCNLFNIFHNQNKIVKQSPKKQETFLQKKRLIDEETGNSIGRWNKDEHRKFIEAIIKFGNNWKDVQKYIDTRTSTQARSHAQKYFEKMRKNRNYLKIFKPLNIDNSDNFTNRTITQLHKLYGNKSKNEINSIVNKFINYESENMKKKRKSFHYNISNKKQSFNNSKKNLENGSGLRGIERENDFIEDENKNIMYENNFNNNQIRSRINSMINNDEIYGHYNSQKNEEENYLFNNNFKDNNFIQSYKGDGIKYILNQLVRNLSQNYCEYDPQELKPKTKRKNTFGSLEENESNLYEENNLAYLSQYNCTNNINNQNINLVSKSRKNSVESYKFNTDKNDMFKRYQGFDENKLSMDIIDMNDLLMKNIFDGEKIVEI
jgi:SHAQKYF class myb-like DNA-binding protein